MSKDVFSIFREPEEKKVEENNIIYLTSVNNSSMDSDWLWQLPEKTTFLTLTTPGIYTLYLVLKKFRRKAVLLRNLIGGDTGIVDTQYFSNKYKLHEIVEDL